MREEACEQSFERNGWRFASATYRDILVSTCTCDGSAESPCKLCWYNSRLSIGILPEMLFHKNFLLLEHVASGASIGYNALDALRAVGALVNPDDQLAAESRWVKPGVESGGKSQGKGDVYDWMFNSAYRGTYSSNMTITPTNERICYELLESREKIDFFAHVPLYEDELADTGCSMMDVKMRCMQSGFYLLQRLYLRLDRALVRVTECRLHWLFDRTFGLREVVVKEAPFSSLTTFEDRQMAMSPDTLSSRLRAKCTLTERVAFS